LHGPRPRKEATMSFRHLLPILGLAAAGAAALHGTGAPVPDADVAPDSAAPVRLIVQNRSYTALQVLIQEGEGRERRLGQAPPDFTTALFVTQPIPAGPVRFRARLPGESENLHTSERIRLTAGTRVLWRLPDNVLQR